MRYFKTYYTNVYGIDIYRNGNTFCGRGFFSVGGASLLWEGLLFCGRGFSSVGGLLFCGRGFSSVGGDSDPRSYILFYSLIFCRRNSDSRLLHFFSSVFFFCRRELRFTTFFTTVNGKLLLEMVL